MKMLRIVLLVVALLAATTVVLVFTVGPGWFENRSNGVAGDMGPAPSAETLAFHDTLTIGDLHADTALWARAFDDRADRGHVDIPRLLEGNFALQMFTTVSKSPRGQNYDSNSADATDNITLLGMVQRWPSETRDSLTARALYQAERIRNAAAASPNLMLVTSRSDLDALMAQRAEGKKVVGALIGTEGSHALDGELDNIDALYDAGFRMMSLQHFFDNKLGGSLHGESNAGLTEFGEQAVDRMVAKGLMIDVSHSSEAVVRDVLARTDLPLIVSHTGFKGHCDRKRNISDETMTMIAEGGGLIGVGYWDEATCGTSVASIVSSLRYGIDIFGLEHIALGSDWDGAVTTPIDAAHIAQLTQALRDAEFSDIEIRAVMGGNMLRFLHEHLPAE